MSAQDPWSVQAFQGNMPVVRVETAKHRTYFFGADFV